MAKQQKFTNRLIKEKSPYLLQHAHNPVDWYPWGPEAFRAAKELDRPIFLSIGYATCHWCHTMEKESFESLEVARLLNETFINIKVDREELPEVDGLYMEFAQSMMAGAAGWPLNVIITPELKPFFAATYLPPHSRHGLMGLIELIHRIQEAWSSPEERERVTMQAEKIVEIFSDNIHSRGDIVPDKQEIEDTAELMFKIADPIYGGMKGAPKFPIGYQSNFMIRYSTYLNDSRAMFLVEKTLDMMHRGGIYDHLGGGFARYSVDEEWLIPHFEKMLYDNALLAGAYLEAWQVTQNPLYQEICEDVLQYILRDMTHSEGGFFSAEDADSEGEEGLFYTWNYEDVKNFLGNDYKLFCEFYDITPHGNFDERNILHTPVRLEEFASLKEMDPQKLGEKFAAQRETLRKIRETRVRPLCDDKILSSWNGLMIYTLAEAGAAFGKKEYIDAAQKAASFIRKNMWVRGHLMRRWREGDAQFNAGLDEYAFLIRGILSLFENGSGTHWLDWAMEMTDILTREFKEEKGAFFQTDGKDENIILRKCQFSDGAEPSGNGIHCENLLRIYQITLDPRFHEEAEDILKGVKKYMDNYAPGYCYHLIDLIRYYDRKAPTIVIALNQKKQFEEEIKHYIYQNYIPHKAVIWRETNDQQLFEIIPYIRQQPPIDGKTTVYICHDGVCQKPLTDMSEIIEAIHKL